MRSRFVLLLAVIVSVGLLAESAAAAETQNLRRPAERTTTSNRTNLERIGRPP